MEDHHLSLTSPGPSGVHHLERPLNITFEFSSQPMLAGQQENMNFTAPETHATGKDPMVRWYEVNDGPWHPPELTAGTGAGGGQPMVSGMRDNQFIVPNRSNMVPSEIMPQSDSGYGSYHNQPSIANGSVCDDSFDTNPDTQSIMGGSIVDAQFSMPDAVSENHIALGVPCDSWASPPIRLETMSMTCRECGKPVKTKSEMRKHDQRHKKPFKCDVSDCPRRIEGFSTPNDLDRHKRSVHPGSQTFGNRYVCQIGACKNKDKIWPRADNFKAHLKRVHMKEQVSDEDLEGCIYKPPTSFDGPQDNSRQEAMSDYSEYSGLPHVQTNNWAPFVEVAHNINSLGPLSEAQGQETLSMSSSQRELSNFHIHHTAQRQELYQEPTEPDPRSHSLMTSSSPIQHNQLSQESEVTEPTSPPTQGQMTRVPRDHSAETQVTSVDPSASSLLDEYSDSLSRNSRESSLHEHLVKEDDGADSIKSEAILASGTGSLKLDLSNLDLNDTSEMRKLVEALQNRGLLEQFGYKKDGSEAGEPTKTEPDAAVNPSPCHPCPHCKKTFPRRCELKKHEKRHEKPYGCTMPDCDKKFGSKNDWKRHENTQHFSLEMWRCDEESCDRLCPRREMFRTHLEKDHQIADQNKLDAKLERCRVGRNCEARFWCGFCQKIVEIKQQGHQAWAERFDHIDEHFSGRNDRARKEISEWKDFDLPRPSKEDFEDGDDSGPSSKNAKAKTKRKRDDGGNLANSKKTRLQSRGLVCCHCGDLVTVSQARCNFPCEHIPCPNCAA
ncbi:hypothetical protein F4823DRAFT_316108 [Ustulina deusta]|nr:hypothetical protein F4823DRAFT_316108 [Ustulina deusta]